ncbi:MAG: type 2 isopentenyl-diphosphate Delta-isomerase [Proteobacteria bacterium]|nr:type 2 isopentenyl-diphosphate Delta-isomerase [Pseudomonadota bacterium]
MTDDIQRRKRDHLSICANDAVAFQTRTTLLEEVELIHCALPEFALADVRTQATFMGRTLQAPLLIGAMTGGTGDNAAFNTELAAVAETLGIGMSLGSLRPALEVPELVREFQVRDKAPNALVLTNIGGAQLRQYAPAQIIDLSRDIGADGLLVHLNTGMELIQPGGDTDFSGVLAHIARLVDAAQGWPVGVKAVGMGISFRDGERLRDAGVHCIETAGAGGTSWMAVEALRATGQQQRLGHLLQEQGIPTAVSTMWMRALGVSVIASGGVATGLDMARALALGADLTAVARPLVAAYRHGGPEEVRTYLDDMIAGLRYTMFLVGAQDLSALRQTPRVIGPALARYADAGLRP